MSSCMIHFSKFSFCIIVLLVFLGVKVLTGEFCIAEGENCRKSEKSEAEQETISSTGMEWFSHGVDNNDLVSQLKNGLIIKSAVVEEAMRKVDRGNYCTNRPYQDSPQYIGYGITISAPHMHAHALEMLKDKLIHGATVLDVGSGKIVCLTSFLGIIIEYPTVKLMK